MPGNDEGEFELVLGNKQLLSVFFVMVVLLGVFFTMGYVVGRNTAEVEVAAAPPEPLVVEAGGALAAAAPMTAAVEPPALVEPEPEPPRLAQAEPPKPPPSTPRASPPPKPTTTSAAGEPSAGTVFLQVAATSRTEGEMLLEVLQRRGFTGRLASVPGQDLSRVLIGPLVGADELSQTRAALQDAGFQPFTRRY